MVELRHIACASQILWRITDAGSYTYFIDGDTRYGFVDTIPVRDGTHPDGGAPVPRAGPSGLRRVRRRCRRHSNGRRSRPMRCSDWRQRWRCDDGRSRPVLVISPAIVQTVTLIPTALVQDTRFQYGTVLVAVVACPLLFADLLRSRSGQAPHDPGESTQSQALPER